MTWRALHNNAAKSFTANPASPCGGVERTGRTGKVLTTLQHAHLSTFHISRKYMKKKEGVHGAQGAQVYTRARLAHHHHPAYSPSVAAKSVTGRRNPSSERRNGAHMALFLCPLRRGHRFYGGRAGQASAWPVPFCRYSYPRTSATRSVGRSLAVSHPERNPA